MNHEYKILAWIIALREVENYDEVLMAQDGVLNKFIEIEKLKGDKK